MRVIKYADVVAMAEKIVDANPDFVYERESNNDGETQGCAYVHQGNVPGCIVGHILIGEDILPAERIVKEGFNRGMGAFNLIDWVNNQELAQVSPKAKHFLSVIQGLQDDGETWGVALEKTEKEIEEYGRHFKD